MLLLFSLNKNVDFNDIMPIYKLNTYFAQTPPYDLTKKNLTASKISYGNAILITIVILATYFYYLYGSSRYLYGSMTAAEIVVDTVLYILICVNNLLAIITGSFSNKKDWAILLNICTKFEGIFKKSDTTQSQFRQLIPLLLENVFVLSVIIYEIYALLTIIGFSTTKYYLLLRLQYYFIFLNVVLSCKFALWVKFRLKEVNTNLKSVFDLKRGNKVQMYNFVLITKKFKQLYSAVDLYNSIFGWQILFFMGTLMLKLLESLNFILFIETNVSFSEDEESKDTIIGISVLTSAIFVVSYYKL